MVDLLVRRSYVPSDTKDLRCRASLFVDNERMDEPLPLTEWPRHRIFPADPETDGERRMDGNPRQAYFYVQDGDCGRSESGGACGVAEGRESGAGAGDGMVWTIWLWLPPLSSGQRSVRVRDRQLLTYDVKNMLQSQITGAKSVWPSKKLVQNLLVQHCPSLSPRFCTDIEDASLRDEKLRAPGACGSLELPHVSTLTRMTLSVLAALHSAF